MVTPAADLHPLCVLRRLHKILKFFLRPVASKRSCQSHKAASQPIPANAVLQGERYPFTALLVMGSSPIDLYLGREWLVWVGYRDGPQRGNGDDGFDIVGLEIENSGGLTFPHQVVAGIATKDYYLGQFGLGPKSSNFTTFEDPIPSYMRNLTDQT